MASLVVKSLTVFTILLLTLAMGLYTGFKNSTDYDIAELKFDGLDGNIEVYRDKWGIPTIIAETEADLFFAQGYEYARDRLFQAEFFRSVASGELSRLFGASDELIDSDKYLRTLSMKDAAEAVYDKLDSSYIHLIERYVAGYNEYIELHKNNLPLEFDLLGVQPKKYTVVDALSIQGVLSRTLSIGALNQELLRLDLFQTFGAEKALELYPLDYYTAENYYLNYNSSALQSQSTSPIQLPFSLGTDDYGMEQASNNWVVGPERSETGNPLLANDPHLDLQTPSIWWQVHLVSPSYHVEGYALPGVPGVIIGHNENLAWGVTNTGTDAVDLFYFETRNDGTEYLINGTWKEFEEDVQLIEGTDNIEYVIKRTDYGPVLDPDLFGVPEDRTYVMRWTLLENHPLDQIVKAVLDLNRAENAVDVHNALKYFNVPGQNFVYGTVDGDFGYQYTGLTPIRKTEGSGILPQNGSDPNFGWSGYIDYKDHLWEDNPLKGYWSTANEEIDYREVTNQSESFYISSLYAPGYRGERIKNLLDNDASVSIQDMRDYQGDTTDLYAKFLIETLRDDINSLQFSDILGDSYVGDAEEAREKLLSWNYEMDRDEIGATVFATFRIFFEEATFKDEFDNQLEYNQDDDIFYDRYDGAADFGIANILENASSTWFDNVETTEIETRNDIVENAFASTIEYLTDKLGNRVSQWDYGQVHHVIFNHPMGGADFLGFLNEGEMPSDGSEHTLKAAGGTPSWSEDGPVFTQSHGPSMRFIAEIETGWQQVFGIVSPGESSNFLSGHRSDGLEDWINNVTHIWNYETTRDGKPDFTYRRR